MPDARKTKAKLAGELETLRARVRELEAVAQLNLLDEIAERRRAEEALRDSQRLLQNFADATPAMLYAYDLVECRVVYANARCAQFFGRSPGKLSALGEALFTEWVHPEDRAQARKEAARYAGLAAGEALTSEYRMRDGRGAWRCLQVHEVVFQRDGTGRPQRLVGAALDVTERREHEAALRRARDQAQTYLDLAGVMFVALDRTGHITLVNRRACEVLGYAEHELVGQDWFARALPVAVREPVRAIFDGLIRGELEPFERAENPIVTKGGATKVIAWHSTVLRDGDGTITGTLASGEDITDRKRAEAELVRASLVVESATDGVAMAAADGRLVYQNRAFGQLSGYTGAALNAAGGLGALYADPAVTREVLAAARDGRSWDGDIEVVTRDGRRVPVALRSYAVRDEAGAVLGLVGVHRDITERKRAQAALEASARQLRQTIDLVPHHIFAVDEAGRFVLLNRSLALALGTTVERAMGRRLRDVLPPGTSVDAWEAENRRVFQTGAELFIPDEPFVTAGGQTRVMQTTRIPIELHGHAGKALLGVAVDVTERKQLEEQLRQSQKMEAVGQLAGGVAHDFNNILTAVLGNVELLRAKLADAPPTANPLRDGLDQIERAGQRAAALTRQLLMFSRRQLANPQVLDLNQVLSDMDKLLRRLLPEHVRLDIAYAPQLGAIRADAAQIEQVIVNLVVNARDAMRDGGVLALRTAQVELSDDDVRRHPDAQPGPHVALAVRDTGCGMDAHTLAHAFEPFFTTKPPGEGTGLGLATVHGIVQQAGGHVTVKTAPGHGSTFTVYLPVVPDPPAVADQAPGMGASEGHETILVCEDDDAVRQLTRRTLEQHGYVVLEAAEGAGALALAAQHAGPIDLLLTDVVMPGLNGRQLSLALTAERNSLRTVYVSGYSADVIGHHGVLDAGVEFLEKPFTSRSLLERIRKVLDARSTAGETLS